ncbi:MAG: hypothetical protein EOP87_26245, partial [Verrucomicrobiaceae bacterium]
MLAKVGDLKAGVAKVAASERDLIKSRAERMAVVRRENLQREEADTDKLNRRFMELDARRQQEIELAHAAAEARGAWIHRAYHASKSALADRAQGVKDRRIGQVQGSIMRNRQARQEELAKAKLDHGEFLAKVAAGRAVRRDLGKAVLKTFRSYQLLIHGRFHGNAAAGNDMGQEGDPYRSHALMLENTGVAAEAAADANRLPLVRLFRLIPLWVILVVVAGMHLWYSFRPGGAGITPALPSFAISMGTLILLWLVGLVTGLPLVRRASSALASARAYEMAAEKQSVARLAALDAEIQKENASEGESLSETFRESDSDWKAGLAEGQKKLDRKFSALPARLESLY